MVLLLLQIASNDNKVIDVKIEVEHSNISVGPAHNVKVTDESTGFDIRFDSSLSISPSQLAMQSFTAAGGLQATVTEFNQTTGQMTIQYTADALGDESFPHGTKNNVVTLTYTTAPSVSSLYIPLSNVSLSPMSPSLQCLPSSTFVLLTLSLPTYLPIFPSLCPPPLSLSLPFIPLHLPLPSLHLSPSIPPSLALFLPLLSHPLPGMFCTLYIIAIIFIAITITMMINYHGFSSCYCYCRLELFYTEKLLRKCQETLMEKCLRLKNFCRNLSRLRSLYNH